METKWLQQRGFTLVELLAVVALITILAAILFPVYINAQERSQGISCLSNTREIGLATLLYSQDANDSLPPGSWFDPISNYTKNLQVFVCPSGSYNSVSYSMNPYVQSRVLPLLKTPSQIVLFADSYQDPAYMGKTAMIFDETQDYRIRHKGQVEYRHNDGANFTFCDGHSKWLPKGSLTIKMWDPRYL